MSNKHATDTFLTLVETSYVVINPDRAGVNERLEIGPAACQQVNPGIIYAQMTGWGQTGPLAQRAGHDINYLGLTGVLHMIGGAEKPRQPVNIGADFGGGAMFLDRKSVV